MFDESSRTRRQVSRVLRDWLTPGVTIERADLTLTAWEVPDEPVPFDEAVTQEYSDISLPYAWSHPWGTTWFHVSGRVPQEWDPASDQRRHEIIVDLGFSDAGPGFQAEGAAYRPDGTMIKALEPLNRYIPIEAAPGEEFELYIEAAANPNVIEGDWVTPPTMGSKETAGTESIYTMTTCELRAIDTTVEALQADLTVLNDLVTGVDSPRREQIIRGLDRALDALDYDDLSGSAHEARQMLSDVLSAPASASATTAYAIGHAHIDSAWLWPLRETRRKVARTWSNVLHLMDVDPDVMFAASSAQQYQWLRDEHPDVFERLRQRVAEGRWVVVGGQWIESDPYMIGGEAMVRQFLEGQRFFQREFGVMPEHVWLPDSFGYSAALPTIARHMGMKWMLTQKLSWNETNTFPHHTLWWEGIDGSRIFTHFPPVDTYNSTLSPTDLHHAESTFRDNGGASRTLVPFGYGDGGGGPTREMLANAHRQKDLEGSPRVRIASPTDFFVDAQAEYPDAPTWVGELYLENHRGVLTSQARTKRGNRRCEHLLREAEYWWTQAAVRNGADYPYDELHEIWQEVLLLQFHDILPGSSIAWVHREAEETFERLMERLNTLINDALSIVAGNGETPLTANASSAEQRGVGAGVIGRVSAQAPSSITIDEGDDGWQISNGVLNVHVTQDGLIDSLVDARRNREVVPAGQVLGRLNAYRDIPVDWDAWNIDGDYRRHPNPIDSVDALDVREEDGAAVVTCERSWGTSTFVQTMRIAPDSATVDFTTEVEWHERRRMLKLELPVDVLTTTAQSEIQCGHITRPIHENTSWEHARFETVGLRWVRVAEDDFGVAVANDRTYGHSFVRMRSDEGRPFVQIGESLLRAPMAPDPDADQGHHVLRTSLTVGAEIDDAIAQGQRLNLPVREVRGDHGVPALVTLDSGHALIEAVKLADDESGDVIVRFHETRGGRTTARFSVDIPHLASIHLVDGLERECEDEADLRTDESGFDVDLKPFELVTVRMHRN